MNTTTIVLYVATGLLMVDSITELSLISSMVAWLHSRAGRAFEVHDGAGGQFSLHGKPENLIVYQGHASNGAGGTAFIVVGLGGILSLWLRSRQLKREGSIRGIVRGLYNFWLTMTVLSAIYSLASFVFVLVVTYSHHGQSIDINVAAELNNHPYPDYVAYPLLEWTPQGWFSAVLQLPLVSESARSDIETQLCAMRAWEGNLIPMTILGFVVMVLAFTDRRVQRDVARYDLVRREKEGAAWML
ncbi:hypothetical protein BDY17DRAFT_323374 [Neohortaea acidophila]|uniref:Uncharacterized protein n=1 Tax=Neohortaea acidophila TaxID=245834 RepID=A0A6A6PXU3_9PEZI|nr:uncharacterized protein BDY17DRAFT_323374 [Neohortaea acidophila]KAF2484529.1 hypothetical protein BDY17DRAFT_323374 [Neohortaea acidophila]